MNLRMVTILVAACLFPLQVMAADGIVGEYDGQVKFLKGYDGKVGDACVAKIAESGKSLSFSLNGSSPLEFDGAKISDALDNGRRRLEVKKELQTPGKEVESAYMIFRQDGSLQHLNLSLGKPLQPESDKIIVCDDFKKR